MKSTKLSDAHKEMTDFVPACEKLFKATWDIHADEGRGAVKLELVTKIDVFKEMADQFQSLSDATQST